MGHVYGRGMGDNVRIIFYCMLQLTTLEQSSRQLEDEKRELMANLNVSLEQWSGCGGGRGGGVQPALFTDKVYTYMCVALCILAVYWRGRDWKAIQKACQGTIQQIAHAHFIEIYHNKFFTVNILLFVQIRGWLVKRGVKGPTANVWRRRYFRCDQGSKIYYYKSSAEGAPQG